jgi:transcription initiation factor IIF auxiliary subunit
VTHLSRTVLETLRAVTSDTLIKNSIFNIFKVRSHLEDETIDALVYLKKYYIRQTDEDLSALLKKITLKIHSTYFIKNKVITITWVPIRVDKIV